MSKLNSWTFRRPQEKPNTNKAKSADISADTAEFLKSGGEIEQCKSEYYAAGSLKAQHNQGALG